MLPFNQTLSGALQHNGVNGRRFIKFYTALVATLALPPRYVAQVASALGKAEKPVLVWLQFEDRAGNSESMLRSSHPSVVEVVLDLLSWEDHGGCRSPGRARTGTSRTRGKGQVHRRGLGSGSPGRWWHVLHDRRENRAGHRAARVPRCCGYDCHGLGYQAIARS